MPELQTAQPVQKLRTQYKIRTPFGLFLAEDLVPVAIVDDLSGASIADVGFPRVARGTATPLAVAAQNPQAQVVGTAGLGKIFHITRVSLDSGTAMAIQLRVNAAADLSGATNVNSKQFMDRGASADLPGLTVSHLTSATLFGQSVATFRLVADVSTVVELNIVLRGFDFVNLIGQTVNTTFNASWNWTEYLLEDR